MDSQLKITVRTVDWNINSDASTIFLHWTAYLTCMQKLSCAILQLYWGLHLPSERLPRESCWSLHRNAQGNFMRGCWQAWWSRRFPPRIPTILSCSAAKLTVGRRGVPNRNWDGGNDNCTEIEESGQIIHPAEAGRDQPPMIDRLFIQLTAGRVKVIWGMHVGKIGMLPFQMIY